MTLRPLTAFLPVPGEPLPLTSALAEDASTWLPLPAEPSAPGEWTVVLRAGPARYAVACSVGGAWHDGPSLWRPVSWSPRGADGLGRLVDRALPDFVGELGLLGDPQATLVLTGGYRPPGGVLGIAGDAAGLHLVADVCGRGFLEDVAKRLRDRVPSVP